MKDYKKKYEEALERAKMEMSKDGIKNDVIARHLAETIFPELVEPEDEKIRKGLIDFVNQYGDNFYGQISKASVIAWLEKQKVKLIKEELERQCRNYELAMANPQFANYEAYLIAKGKQWTREDILLFIKRLEENQEE